MKALIWIGLACLMCGCKHRTVVRVPTPWGNAWLLANETNAVKIEVTVNPR